MSTHDHFPTLHAYWIPPESGPRGFMLSPPRTRVWPYPCIPSPPSPGWAVFLLLAHILPREASMPPSQPPMPPGSGMGSPLSPSTGPLHRPRPDSFESPAKRQRLLGPSASLADAATSPLQPAKLAGLRPSSQYARPAEAAVAARHTQAAAMRASTGALWSSVEDDALKLGVTLYGQR